MLLTSYLHMLIKKPLESLLSARPKDVRVTRAQKNKTKQKNNTIVLPDHTKGGVNIVDLLSSKLSVQMKSRRWALNALIFILYTSDWTVKQQSNRSSNKFFQEIRWSSQQRPLEFFSPRIASFTRPRQDKLQDMKTTNKIKKQAK